MMHGWGMGGGFGWGGGFGMFSMIIVSVLAIVGDEVRIGEVGNLSALKNDEWNVLVDLIEPGQLSRIRSGPRVWAHAGAEVAAVPRVSRDHLTVTGGGE